MWSMLSISLQVILVIVNARVGGGLEETFPRTRVINTRKGKVQGRTISLVGGEYNLDPVDIFLGIPYALPPTGIWRLSPTQDLPPWPGVLQATSPGPACPQQFPRITNKTEALKEMSSGYLEHLSSLRSATLSMSEDCLYLNIYAPTDTKDLAVMVFLHGESFSFGSANLYDARVLATLGKIIVVTFNYRMGILGFLNTNPNPERKGEVANYGLIDQMAALQWVSENIAEFGGDPNRVTLVGHGHGSAMAEYLVHSPLIRQSHFHRVILMSGSIFASWARVEDPAQVAVKIARQLGCSIPADLSTHHTNIVHCLRSKSLDEILSVDVGQPLSFMSNMGPSFDGVILKNNFVHIRSKRSFDTRSYDAIIGVSSNEWIHQLGEDTLLNGLSKYQRDQILRTYITNNYENHLNEIFLAVNNEYLDMEEEEKDPIRLRNLTLEALSDAMYGSPGVHSAASFYRRRNSTYFYHFNQPTKFGFYPQSYNIGPIHGEELQYLFGIPICNVWQHKSYHFTRTEALHSARIITYFSNFVKSGNPNSPDDLDQILKTGNDTKKRTRMVTWEPYDDKKNYLEIDPKLHMRSSYRRHQMSLWLRLLPQLEQAGRPAYSGGLQALGGWSSSWGRVRNVTILRVEERVGEVSPCNINSDSGELMTIGLAFGLVLLSINFGLIFYICYNKRNTRNRWERNERGAGSTECLNNSIIENQSVPSFCTPGRTATLRRQAPAIPLASFEEEQVAQHSMNSGVRDASSGLSGSSQYTTCSSLPLVAEIPAPRQFTDPERQKTTYRQNVITC